MGGDRAPDQNIQGAVQYARAGGRAHLILVGRRADLEPRARAAGLDVEIVDAPDVAGMAEHPSAAPRRRTGTAVGVATRLGKEGPARPVVSAGNTGAVVAAAALV